MSRSGGGWINQIIHNTDAFLFFAQVKNAEGGELANEMQGASDFISISGSAGSYEFICPDNSDYLNADSDFIWHYTSGGIRTVSEAELVGYDFSRTLIKYEDDSPNSIEWIAILKNGFTATSAFLDKMHLAFRLPIYWGGTLNDNGVLKSNRSLERSVWTPEAGVDPDVAVWLHRLTTPLSEVQEERVEALIVGIKEDLNINHLNDRFDAMYLFAAETEEAALKNLVAPEFDCTKAGGTGPSFTSLEGFTGDTVWTARLETGWSAKEDGSNYQRDSACAGVYIRSLSDDGNRAYFGAADITAPAKYNHWFVPHRGSSNRFAIINSGIHNLAFDNDQLGLHVLTRSDSAANKWHAPDQVYSYTISSTELVDVDTAFLCLKLANDSQTGANNGQISFGFLGANLTDEEVVSIRTRINTYMTANGKGL